MSVSAVIWGLLAVLVFWAIGAYNRLMRLRGRGLAAFSAIDKQFSQQALWLQPFPAAQNHFSVGPSLLPTATAQLHRWSGLIGAGRQLEASLKAARAKPLDGESLNALRTAHETLVTSWTRCRDEPPDLAGSTVPEDLAIKWDHLMVQSDMARAEFNQLACDYNAAIKQIPARLLAWLFGFKPIQTL